MTKYVPVKFQSKQQHVNWMNTLVHVHDLQCNCDDPLEHTIHTIFKQETNLRIWDSTKNLIKKCLTTTTTPEEEDDDVPFGDGELEALFATEDIGETKTTTDTVAEPR